MNNLRTLRRFSVATFALSALPALASLGPTFFTITATNAAGTGSYTLNSNDPAINYDIPNDYWTWSGSSIALLDGPNQVALLDAVQVGAQGDPFCSLNFVVVAGATDTHFTISSTTLSFGPFANPQYSASAGVTLTDESAVSNGALLTGTNYASDVVQFDLNGGPFLAGIAGVNVIPPSNSGNDQYNSGFQNLVGVASSISIGYDFVLSAGDAMSSNSSFFMTPEPASLALLALGSLLLRRR